jgi:ribosomal protein L16/L10AE
VDRDQEVIALETSQSHFTTAKQALKRAAVKLPSPCYIVVERGKAPAK